MRRFIPLVLAGLMKVTPGSKYPIADLEGAWNRNGSFWIYRPDFLISVFNQVLLLGGGGDDIFHRAKMV